MALDGCPHGPRGLGECKECKREYERSAALIRSLEAGLTDDARHTRRHIGIGRRADEVLDAISALSAVREHVERYMYTGDDSYMSAAESAAKRLLRSLEAVARG